ncbi:MAG TPA: hypothetical protein VGK79_04370 [Gaiellaceae bacterium]
MSTAQRSEIESLLEQLDDTRRRIYLSKARGVRAAGLRDLKSEYASVQESLRLYTALDGD